MEKNTYYIRSDIVKTISTWYIVEAENEAWAKELVQRSAVSQVKQRIDDKVTFTVTKEG